MDEQSCCLVVKSALVLGQRDPTTATLVHEHFTRMEDALSDLLLRARGEGEISKDKHPRRLARLLINTLNGLNVAASAGQSSRTLRETTRDALTVLD